MSDNLILKSRMYRKFSEALYSALADDPFYSTMEKRVGDLSKSKEAMLCYYDYSIYEAACYGHVFQPEVETYGISVWSTPLNAQEAAQKSEDKKSMILSQMGKSCLQAYEEINAFMSGAAEPLISDRDWYLSIVGILPEYQGKGLGGNLIQPILKKADAVGISTFLETFTPRNMPFYERLGYETLGVFLEPVTRSNYWLMRREPG